MGIRSSIAAIRALQSPRPITVRKSGGQNPAMKITRIIRPTGQPAPVTVTKGDLVPLADHRPQPPKADPHSTDFGEVLRAKMGPPFDLSPLMNNTQTAKAEAEVVELKKSAEQIVVRKASQNDVEVKKEKGPKVLRAGQLRANDQIAEVTAQTIECVVREAADATFERINAQLEGRQSVAKAEPETNLERIERERNERQDELAGIDAQIMLGTSGLIDCYLPEPSGVTKAEADGDSERWRRSMGLQAGIRKEPFPGAR